MTSDQIYLERETGREKKERWGCFGNTVHLTFMPIKETELKWIERERELGDWKRRQRAETEERMRDGWDEKAETERRGKIVGENREGVRLPATLQPVRQRGQVLYQNKTHIPRVWHPLRPKQNSILTRGKTDIAMGASERVTAWGKTSGTAHETVLSFKICLPFLIWSLLFYFLHYRYSYLLIYVSFYHLYSFIL